MCCVCIWMCVRVYTRVCVYRFLHVCCSVCVSIPCIHVFVYAQCTCMLFMVHAHIVCVCIACVCHVQHMCVYVQHVCAGVFVCAVCMYKYTHIYIFCVHAFVSLLRSVLYVHVCFAPPANAVKLLFTFNMGCLCFTFIYTGT